jgi:putative glutamine amidotransferase
MNKPVLIAISMRPSVGKDHPPRAVQNRSYLAALEAAGATPLLIPPLNDPRRLRQLYDMCGGLVLPGGPDVEPRRYGATVREDSHVTSDPELDELELRLAGWALEDGLPLLAICRGIQVLNVAAGGTLWQDLEVEGATSEPHDVEPRDFIAHEVDVEPDSLLARTTGRVRMGVNSLHHQAVREVGRPLRIVARSSDGLIEGVEVVGHPFGIGVQCHPEELAGKEKWAAALFSGLVAAAEERSFEGGPSGSIAPPPLPLRLKGEGKPALE